MVHHIWKKLNYHHIVGYAWKTLALTPQFLLVVDCKQPCQWESLINTDTLSVWFYCSSSHGHLWAELSQLNYTLELMKECVKLTEAHMTILLIKQTVILKHSWCEGGRRLPLHGLNCLNPCTSWRCFIFYTTAFHVYHEPGSRVGLSLYYFLLDWLTQEPASLWVIWTELLVLRHVAGLMYTK